MLEPHVLSHVRWNTGLTQVAIQFHQQKTAIIPPIHILPENAGPNLIKNSGYIVIELFFSRYAFI